MGDDDETPPAAPEPETEPEPEEATPDDNKEEEGGEKDGGEQQPENEGEAEPDEKGEEEGEGEGEGEEKPEPEATEEEPTTTEQNEAPGTEEQNDDSDNEESLLADVFKNLSGGDLAATLPPEKLTNLLDSPPEETSFDTFCELVRTAATDQTTVVRVVLARAFYRERFETLYDSISQYWVTRMVASLGSEEPEEGCDISKDVFCDVMLAAVTKMSVDAVLEKCEEIMRQTEGQEGGGEVEEKEEKEEKTEEPLIPGEFQKEPSSPSMGDDPLSYCDPVVPMKPMEHGSYSPPAKLPHGMGQPISSTINVDDIECDYVDFHLDEIAETATNFSSDTSSVDLSKMSVGKRLYYAGCGAQQRKDEYLRQERQRMILTELGQMANPHITEMGREAPCNTDEYRSMGMHPRRGESKFEQLKSRINEQRKELEESSMKKVELAPMTKYIVETSLSRRYKGPVTGWETHRDRHAAKQVRVHVDTRDSFIPNINRSSSQLTRDGKVFSRLYTDASTRSERQTTRSEEYHSQLRESPKVHTNPSIIFRKSPSPSPSPAEASPAADDTVVHRLLSAGQVMARKKEKLSVLMKKKEEQFTFKPQLTDRSLELAAAYRERKEKERERRRIEQAQQQQQQHQRQQQQQYTPRRSTYSRSRDSSEKDDTFLNRSYRQQHQRRERMATLLAEKKEMEFKECTFQPEINPNTEALLGGRGRDPMSPSPTRVYSRSFFETDDPVTPPSVTSRRREASLSQSPFDRPAPTVSALNIKVEQQISAVLEEWNKVQGL